MSNTLSNSISYGIIVTTPNTYQYYQQPFTFTITSTGTINPGNSDYGAIGVYGPKAGLTLINQGVVDGGNGTVGSPFASTPGGAGGTGIALLGASSLSNSGTIRGGNGGIAFNSTGGAGGTGVDLSGGTLTNSGTITGGNGGAGGIGSGSGGVGVFLPGGTLFNAGTISGGVNNFNVHADAVQFGTGAGTLVVEAGASFVGSVVADRYSNADVLAIGGSAPVTVAGIGIEYRYFHTLGFESGASGTFAGSLTNLTGESITGFARGDGFYVNGFTAANTIATIGAGGTLAIAGTGAGQTLDLTFASAAIGGVLDLTAATGGTGINFDPHILNNFISTGITLTPTGNSRSPFTITSNGTVAPTAYGAIGVNGSAVANSTLINQGVINGGGGKKSYGAGGAGGAGVDLSGPGSFSDAGTIIGGAGGSGYGYGVHTASGNRYYGGVGGAGGAGADLSSAGSYSNSGRITGGIGGTGRGITIHSGSNYRYYFGIGGTGGAGVALTDAGSFNNSSIIIGGAGGSGYRAGGGGAGVDFSGTDSFSNSGTITAGNGGNGVFTGRGGNGVVLSGSGSFTNSGAITGGNGGSYRYRPFGGGGAGVDLTGTGSFTNNGIITGGSNGTGGAGVDLSGTGSFSNNSTISGGRSGYGGAGVDFTGTGSFSNSGFITGGSSTYEKVGGVGVVGGAGVSISGAGTFANSGTITGDSGGFGYNSIGSAGIGVYLNGGTLLNSGLIVGGNDYGSTAHAVQFGTNASTLIVEQGATFNSNVVANNTVSDVLAIGGNSAVSLVGLGTEYQNFHTLAFDTGATGTASGTYTAWSGLNVTGFTLVDTLILDGFAATTDTYVAGTGLELGNGTSTITIDITGNFTTANFNVVDPPGNTTISLNPPCFAAGTRILTARGEIPVEQMQQGTPVILTDGRIVPVTWLGHRTLDIARHPHPETVRPVLIMAGAIRDDVPARDLYLSPDHALHLDGHLIPAKTLINGSTIRQVDRRTVTYYHVELPDHAVLLAEGTPCESYLDSGNRPAFENGGAPAIALHPAFGPATPDWQTIRQTRSCSPVTEDGPAVEAVRARLLSRADIATTSDADLAITRRADGSIAITSRSMIPGHLSPDPRDRRRLGVKIASIVRKDGTVIPLDHPDLVTGWHNPEPDGRWTTGHALIPASLAGVGLPGVTLAATHAYPTAHTDTGHRKRHLMS